MQKLGVGLSLLMALGFGACKLLPERYALNAPLGHLLLGAGRDAPPEEAFGSRIRGPEGSSVALFAAELPNARFLRFTPTGDLLVSQPRSGRIVLLEPDASGDGRSDGRSNLLDGLNRPHGLDLHDGWLYVAESDAVARIRFDPASRSVDGELERIVTDLPGGGNHWSRSLRFGPDGWMYVSIGSSCNVCEESDRRRAALLRYRADGSGQEIFATGLRNAVGFDWHPVTGELYATDNGRDLLGDDTPPCELNRVVGGGFYGWPYAYGDNHPDPDLGAGHAEEISGALPPVHAFRAHNAPLGISFPRADDTPSELRGGALVALHGSWNRSRKDGYKVVSLHWLPDGSIEERDFLVGFLEDGDVIGRPVDVAQGPEGAFYVSDDYAGSIYRVSYDGGAGRARETSPHAIGAVPVEARAGQEPEDLRRRGEELYTSLDCGRCHDASRSAPGATVMPLQDLDRRYGVDSLLAYLAAPAPPMPLFDLTDDERRALAIFLLAGSP